MDTASVGRSTEPTLASYVIFLPSRLARAADRAGIDDWDSDDDVDVRPETPTSTVTEGGLNTSIEGRGTSRRPTRSPEKRDTTADTSAWEGRDTEEEGEGKTRWEGGREKIARRDTSAAAERTGRSSRDVNFILVFVLSFSSFFFG